MALWLTAEAGQLCPVAGSVVASVHAQIFVEIERARLTRRLAAIKEAEGNITEAADTLQEVPVVSTCGCGISAYLTEQSTVPTLVGADGGAHLGPVPR